MIRFFSYFLIVFASSNIQSIYERDFYQWIANNFREVTAQPLTDPDYFNYIRISSKDGMYHKGKTIGEEDMNIIKNAENIYVTCDKRSYSLVSLPTLLLSVKSVKSIFLKNILIPGYVSNITQFYNLREAELHSCTLDDVTCFLPDGCDIRKLVLDGCDIKNCTFSMAKAPNLEELVIVNSNLHSISKDAFLIKSLKKISFRNNQMIAFPVLNESDVPVTENLELDRNRFTSFPKELYKFKKLKNLDLSFNLIEGFEKPITTTLFFENLNLEGNMIKHLPSGVSHFKFLKSLNLSHNLIEDAGTEIFQLPEIERLDLSFNKINSLDETISLLMRELYETSRLSLAKAPLNLREINLSYNFLRTIPLSFKCFSSLQRLDLDGNLLNEIPDAIFSMNNLMVLKLSYNRIVHVSETLSVLPMLIELYLEGGQDFRTIDGPTNQILLIPRKLLNHKSRKVIKLFLKGNKLLPDSSLEHYGYNDIVKDFKNQVYFT